jgi:hypothetical protein
MPLLKKSTASLKMRGGGETSVKAAPESFAAQHPTESATKEQTKKRSRHTGHADTELCEPVMTALPAIAPQALKTPKSEVPVIAAATTLRKGGSHAVPTTAAKPTASSAHIPTSRAISSLFPRAGDEDKWLTRATQAVAAGARKLGRPTRVTRSCMFCKTTSTTGWHDITCASFSSEMAPGCELVCGQCVLPLLSLQTGRALQALREVSSQRRVSQKSNYCPQRFPYFPFFIRVCRRNTAHH